MQNQISLLLSGSLQLPFRLHNLTFRDLESSTKLILGRSTKYFKGAWKFALKEIISQTDYYYSQFVFKNVYFEDKITKY